MYTRFTRKNKNSYTIVKGSRNYGKFQDMDDATLARDILIQNDWDLDSIGQIYEDNGQYLVLGIIDEKIHLLARCKRRPSQKEIDRLTKRKARNPNNSRYGLNITRVFDTFIVKKRIAGEDCIFGYYDRLEDAEFVRNHLMDNSWNVNSFSQIQYDDDKGNYKVTEIIGDRTYVLGSFESEDDIDLDCVYRKFLNRIAKHKLGLDRHDYLDELTDEIPNLEERFDIKAQDEVWDLKSTSDPLNDIIFRLTPFQKSVYDVIDNSTIEEIEKALIRFRSGNFKVKIQKSLDELERQGLVTKNQNHYMKKE